MLSKAPYKITSLYTAIVLGIFPLWTGFGSYSSITGAKYRFFVPLSVCYIVLMAVAVCTKAAKGIIKEDKRPGIECMFLAAFLLWAGVSCALSPYDAWRGEGRREGFMTLMLYVIPVLFIAVYGRLSLWHMFVLAGAVTVNSALGFLQLLGLDPLDLFPRGLTFYDAGVHYAGAYLGTLGNTNILSAFLSLALPLLAGGSAAFSERKGAKLLLIPCFAGSALLTWARVSSGTLALICCAVFALPFIVSTSEMRQKWCPGICALTLGAAFALVFPFTGPHFAFSPSFAGFALALLAFIFSLIRRCAAWEYKVSAKSLIFFWLTLLIAALAILYFIPFSSGTLREAHLILHGDFDPSFGSSRLRIWKRALELIGEKPIFGSGPDTFIKRVGFEFSRFIEETAQLRQVKIDCAHNDYLNIAANCGLGALIFFLLALCAVFIKALKSHRNATVFALLAAFAAYAVQLAFTFSICSVSPLFYLALGLTGSEARKNGAKASSS